MSTDNQQKIIQDRFAELPESVQLAVTDASVEKKLRALSEKYKLHLDQWVLLENEIMLTLLGLEEPQDMAENVAREVEVDKELAQQIVNDIAVQIFQPIREQLQGTLQKTGDRRETVEVPTIGTDQAQKRQEAIDTLLKKEKLPREDAEEKTAPTDSTAYKPGQSSAERHDVQEDPYRESIE